MTDCPLTERELECIKWLSEGHTVPEIANLLQRSLEAIKSRLVAAKDKTGTTTAAGLVGMAIRKGWLA